MGRSLRRQTFDNFDLSLYDDRPLPGGISPRQVMAKNLSTAKAFVQNFPDGGRSLLMTGPSGLGKTHLSSAIGGELAARGYHVVYEMAPTLLQKLEDVKFGRRAPRGGVSKLRPAHCGRPGQRIHHRLFHCRPLCPFGRAAGARQAGASSAPISRPMSSSKTTPKLYVYLFVLRLCAPLFRGGGCARGKAQALIRAQGEAPAAPSPEK